MQSLVIVLHVLTAIGIISLVLLQHGKGADMGASFGGGASNTVFGSRGSVPFLMKITAILAAIFFATSIGLSYLVATAKPDDDLLNIPATRSSAPATPTQPGKKKQKTTVTQQPDTSAAKHKKAQ